MKSWVKCQTDLCVLVQIKTRKSVRPKILRFVMIMIPQVKSDSNDDSEEAIPPAEEEVQEEEIR